jgi:hypothetical protein
MSVQAYRPETGDHRNSTAINESLDKGDQAKICGIRQCPLALTA